MKRMTERGFCRCTLYGASMSTRINRDLHNDGCSGDSGGGGRGGMGATVQADKPAAARPGDASHGVAGESN